MKKQYLFYDLETSGLNKAFDQIFQFAAIITDDELNPKQEIEWFTHLRPDVIPSPKASITHRISIAKANSGDCEYDVVKKIHTLINTENTISIGYNNLNFDDEFLRFCFYRNLLPPYTHQFANNCQRMDIFPIVIMYFLFRPELINWPEVNGKISLKLADIAAANNFNFGNAHDALVDVKATLALAKQLRQDEKMWNYVIGYFDKRIDIERCNALDKINGKFPLGIYVSSQIGKENQFHIPVLGLGQHRIYKNQTLWLRLDTPLLNTTTPESVTENTFVFNKKYGEPGFLLAYRPRYYQKLSKEVIEQCQTNLNWLKSQPDVLTAIVNHYANYTHPPISELDASAALYDQGFLSPTEEQQCRQFHQEETQNKFQLLEQISNPVLHELGLRLLANTYPDHLPTAMAEEYTHYLADIYQNTYAVNDYRGQKKLLPNDILTEISTMINDATLEQEQINLLQELQQYISAKMSKYDNLAALKPNTESN